MTPTKYYAYLLYASRCKICDSCLHPHTDAECDEYDGCCPECGEPISVDDSPWFVDVDINESYDTSVFLSASGFPAAIYVIRVDNTNIVINTDRMTISAFGSPAVCIADSALQDMLYTCARYSYDHCINGLFTQHANDPYLSDADRFYFSGVWYDRKNAKTFAGCLTTDIRRHLSESPNLIGYGW